MSSTTTARTEAGGAELFVKSLNSLEQEEIHRNAEKKTIHFVVKVLPFTIDLAIRGTHDPYEIDFHKFTLQNTLVYDTPDERPVDWVKLSPIDCVVQVNETGECATAEVRLHVLSSQHEDLAFRIKFTAVPPASRAHDLKPLTVVTDPIKVVSKQSQLKKNKKPPAVRKRQKTVTATPPPHAPTTAGGIAATTPPAAATVSNEVNNEQKRFIDSLSRIEAQQRKQQELINSLLQTVATVQQQQQQQQQQQVANSRMTASSPVADVGSPLSPPDYSGEEESSGEMRVRKRTKYEQHDERSTEGSPNQTDGALLLFEHHLTGLLAIFNQLPSEERTSSIHRVFRDHATRASEVIETLLSESLSAKLEEDPHNMVVATADLSNYEPLSYDHIPTPATTTEVERTLYLPKSQSLRPQQRTCKTESR